MWTGTTLTWLLVALVNLMGLGLQQPTNTLSTTYMDETLTKLNETRTKDVAGARQAYIQVKGPGLLEIRVHRGDIVHSVNNCSSTYYHEHTCLVWSYDTLAFDNKEVFRVDVKPLILNGPQMTVKLLGGEFIEVNPIQGIEIFTGSAHSADLLIYMDNFQGIDAVTSRLQFCVKQIDAIIQLQQTLDIYVAKGKTRVLPTKTNYSGHAQMALGTMVTILPHDQMHCMEKCYYSVHLEFSNVNLLGFFMIIKSQDPVIHFHHTQVRLLENLRPNDQTTYVFETTDQSVDWNWRFFISPIEGNPDIAVHFDEKPTDLTKYHWKSSQAQMEGLFIKESEIKEQGFKTRRAYMTVYSDVGATFFIQAALMRPGDPIIIDADSPYTSYIEAGGQNNYKYRFIGEQPTKVELYAKLRMLEGDADLYVRNCKKEDPTCVISEHEIKTWNSLETKAQSNTSLLYKHSQQAGVVDETLLLKFNCIPNNDNYTNFTYSMPQVMETRDCSLGLAVVGQKTPSSKSSKYILELKFSKFLIPLAPQKQIFLTIPPDSVRYFRVDGLDPSRNHKFFSMKFLINSGEAQVWISQKTHYPNELAHDKAAEVKPDYDTHLKTIFISTPGTADSLKKPFYVAIKVLNVSPRGPPTSRRTSRHTRRRSLQKS